MSKTRMKILKKEVVSGKNLVFRYPRSADLKDLMRTINSLVQERVEIAKTKKVSYKQEKIWLSNVLKSIRKNETIMVVVEMDGVVVGSCQITKDPFDVSRHVGTLGVALRKQGRGIGIGSKLIELSLIESRKIGIKLVKLYVFNTNNTARRLYKKFGFVDAGKIRNGVFHGGRYKDDIIMIKRL